MKNITTLTARQRMRRCLTRFMTLSRSLLLVSVLVGCAVSESADVPDESETRFQAQNLKRHLVIQDAMHFLNTLGAGKQLRESKRGALYQWWSNSKEVKKHRQQTRNLQACADSAGDDGHVAQQKMCLKLLGIIAPELEKPSVELAKLAAVEEARQKEKIKIDQSIQASKDSEKTSLSVPQNKKPKTLTLAQKLTYNQKFSEALEDQDVLKAESILSEEFLASLTKEERLSAKSRLGMLKAEKVVEGLRLGQHYYSQGNLNRALTVWQNTRELDPDNLVLQKNIQRVEVFIENLKQIRKLNQSVEL